MPEPLSLLKSRAIQAGRYRQLRREVDFGKGVAGLTTPELAEFEELRHLSLCGEFATEGMSEEKLATTAARRIRTMQREVEEGRPPFKPELRGWKWDTEAKVFRWTNRMFPEGAFGHTWKPEGVEGPPSSSGSPERGRVPIQ